MQIVATLLALVQKNENEDSSAKPVPSSGLITYSATLDSLPISLQTINTSTVPLPIPPALSSTHSLPSTTTIDTTNNSLPSFDNNLGARTTKKTKSACTKKTKKPKQTPEGQQPLQKDEEPLVEGMLQPSTKPAKQQKKYIPGYRSGPWALLMALYQASMQDTFAGYLQKKELIEEATPYCDSSFEQVRFHWKREFLFFSSA
jgi:hypothetical protein